VREIRLATSGVPGVPAGLMVGLVWRARLGGLAAGWSDLRCWRGLVVGWPRGAGGLACGAWVARRCGRPVAWWSGLFWACHVGWPDLS